MELEQFLYVLEGGVDLKVDDRDHHLVEGGYCWLPPGRTYGLLNQGVTTSRLFWLRRRYPPQAGIPVPTSILPHKREVVPPPEAPARGQPPTPSEPPPPCRAKFQLPGVGEEG